MDINTKMRTIIKKLIIKEPFWGSLIMQCQIVETDQVWVAGMSMHNNQLFLYVNQKNFWDPKLTDIHRRNILKHEILHAAFLHPMRLKNFQQDAANYCADCEVNSYIPDLKDLPEKFKGVFPSNKKWPEKKTAEWYYSKIPKQNNGGGSGQNDQQSTDPSQENGQNNPQQNKKNNPQKDKQPSNGPQLKPSKPMPKNSTPQQRANNAHKDWDTFRPAHKGIIKKMLDQASTAAGKTPSGLKDILDSLYKGVLDWRWLLQRAMTMGTMKCQKVTSTWTRPNRRNPDLKGKKRLRMPEIVVAVDTSGSMSNKDIKQCFSEINKIANTARALYLMQFSCGVTKCEKVKRLKQTDIELVDRGGTDFNSVYNYVEKKIPSKHPLVIILTDGEDNEGNSRTTFELVWVILENRNTTKSWGKVIILPESKETD